MENNNLPAIYRAQASAWLERAIEWEVAGDSKLAAECFAWALEREQWAIDSESWTQ